MRNDQQLTPTVEAARILDVHTATVHRLVERGDLVPAVKAPGIRGAMMFRPADVERLARARAKAAAKKAS